MADHVNQVGALDGLDAHVFTFNNITIDELSEVAVVAAAEGFDAAAKHGMLAVTPNEIAVDNGVFLCRLAEGQQVRVAVVQSDVGITVSSNLPASANTLTRAESLVLIAILRRDELGVFFSRELRQQLFRQEASAYGLEHEQDLEQYFIPTLSDGMRLSVQPRIAGLLPFDSPKLLVLSDGVSAQLPPGNVSGTEGRIIVLSRHKFYRHIQVDIVRAGRTKAGKLKPPFTRLPPLELVATATEINEAKCYAAMASIQQVTTGDRAASDFEALQTIVKCNTSYPFYWHDDEVSETFSTKTLTPVKVEVAPRSGRVSIRASGAFYSITGTFTAGARCYPLHELPCYLGYFFRVGNTFYLPDNKPLLDLAALLREQDGQVLIHASKYRSFKREVLDKLPATIGVDYPDVASGTLAQLQAGGFIKRPERLLYLSDFGDFVMIIPVVRYGEAEVAIRTEQPLMAIDGKGSDFKVPRDPHLEEQFLALLVRQHPYLPEQLENSLYYLYLHKKYFLDEKWFLPVFETWQEEGIDVYGFNEISGSDLNSSKVTITIRVISGINWFNATYDVRYGRNKVGLRKIQAALRNKRRYVVLDDGTKGILPQIWIDKFSDYFRSGEVVDQDTIRFAKANFETVDTLFDQRMLDTEVVDTIAELRRCLTDFDTLPEVTMPAGVTVKLRPYQQRGLNWLSFLDRFDVGGILADEMGLGKTVQIIVFMQALRQKKGPATHLVVAPTTLIFNWERELATVSPMMQVLTFHGANRPKTTQLFNHYDVVLTSYATMLSDIQRLKAFDFDYVFLDESQNIKNPDSQRYKAARLLRARNRIAISGTPFENSSFDLYGQLSFVCPGLLGDKRYFSDVYAKPIDQFKNKKRRLELQQKIQPFILRRTKDEVAGELPEKVHHVLYCEMGEEQRKIYEAYESEFRDFVCALSGDKLDKSAMHVLRGLTRLRQICNSPALLPDGMLNTAVSAKIELLRSQLTDMVPHHKVIVFSQFVSMLHLVGNMLTEIDIPYVSLTGNTRQRSDVVRRFNEDADVRVFLVSLKTGGTGLNLTGADVVYLVDPWWNPAVENQAIDRVHRIGQRKDVVAYRLVTPNTVEEKVATLQTNKSALADSLLNRDKLLSLL